jgi:non-canonical purine NTP pyrophosphatase (RdgB/HAM1 family)
MGSPVLTFVTSNPNKASQLAQWLARPVDHRALQINEIQTVELDLLIQHKVRAAYQQIQVPVLVDDVALTFHALGRLPGPFIKFFTDELGLEKCCRLLDSFDNRQATATVKYGLTYDGQSIQIFTGIIHGVIAPRPVGEGGFGWDAIFIPDGFKDTRAQLNEADYEATSPRAMAISYLSKYLQKITAW